METYCDIPSDKPILNLSAAIQLLLQRKDRRQKDICCASSLTSAYISQLANGKRKNPTMDTWIKAAAAFDINVEQLVHLSRLLGEGVDADTAYSTAILQHSEMSPIDGFLQTVKTYWLSIHGDNPQSLWKLTGRFPEINEWLENQDIIKNPAECGA